MSVSYYDIFVDACKRFSQNVAVILVEDGVRNIYLYSDMFRLYEELYKDFVNFLAPGECVGLMMKHSPHILPLVAAIHKCGCSFMFLNPTEDQTTNIKLIKDFQITKLFSKNAHINLNDFEVVHLNCGDEIQIYFFRSNVVRESLWKDCNNIFAYCIRTSGSTSIQKNVIVPHSSIYPNVKDLSVKFDVQQNDIILFSTALTFDPSMIELYLSAFLGVTLLITDNILQIFNCDMIQFNFSSIIWQTTPSLFLKCGYDNIKKYILCENSKLKVLALGGESFNFAKLLDLKHENNKTIIFNLYGITEVSCWASVRKIDPSQMSSEVDIGDPLCETVLRIVSDGNEEIVEGLGAIEIGSSSRKCVVSADELKIDRSIFYNGNILWHCTGDIGEKKTDGRIYFRGRKDRLIKRFGHKVNLLEIENVALTFTGIKQVACIWLPKEHSICLVAASDEKNIEKRLTQFLHEKLNQNCFPDVICVVVDLPLSCHGKISLTKVYNLYEKHFKRKNESVEQYFMNILKENLNYNLEFDDIKDKSFLNLGGNSIIAMQILNKLEHCTNLNTLQLFNSFINSKYSLEHVLKLITQHSNLNINSTLNNENLEENDAKRKLPARNNDVKRVALSVNSKDNEKIKLQWKINLDKCIDANPVLFRNNIGQEYVLVGSHSGKVAMVETSSGTLTHMWEINSRIEASVLCIGNSDQSNFKCVLGAYDGNLWCFSLQEPYETIWKTPLEAMIKSQACYLESYVFAATYEGVIWQIDLESGTIISSVSIKNESIFADLTISNCHIFTATLRGTCACVSVTPSRNEMEIKWMTTLSSPVFAKPTLINDNRQVLFCEAKGLVHCLDAVSGDQIWNFADVQGPIFSSCLHYKIDSEDFITFGCHDEHAYHLKHAGECDTMIALTFKSKHSSQVFATPCIYKTKFIIYVSTKGQLQVVNIHNRQIVCEFVLPGEVFSSPVTSNDEIYLGCRDNYLYCLKLDIHI